MIVRIFKNKDNTYNITNRGGVTIHSNKPLDFVLNYLNNQLQTGFEQIRIIV